MVDHDSHTRSAEHRHDSAQPQDAKRKRDSAQPQDAKRKRDSAQPQDAKRKRDSAQPQDAKRKRDSAQPQDAKRKRDSAQPQDAKRKRDSAQPQDAKRKRDSAQPQELFLGIDHTAIVIGDTESSLRFYRDALGLKQVGESENYGVEQEHLNNVFGARIRITALRAGSGPGVEFIEYIAPRDGRPYPAEARSSDVFNWQTN